MASAAARKILHSVQDDITGEHIVHIDGGKNPMTAGGGNFIGFFLKL